MKFYWMKKKRVPLIGLSVLSLIIQNFKFRTNISIIFLMMIRLTIMIRQFSRLIAMERKIYLQFFLQLFTIFSISPKKNCLAYGQITTQQPKCWKPDFSKTSEIFRSSQQFLRMVCLLLEWVHLQAIPSISIWPSSQLYKFY